MAAVGLGAARWRGKSGRDRPVVPVGGAPADEAAGWWHLTRGMGNPSSSAPTVFNVTIAHIGEMIAHFGER